MSEQKLIAESRTFEQQMIERDKRATKSRFCCWRYGSADCGTGARRRGRDVAAETDGRWSCIPWIIIPDGWRHVARTSKTSLTATEAYQKAMAANYVKVRERYVYPLFADDYETVFEVYNAPIETMTIWRFTPENAPRQGL